MNIGLKVIGGFSLVALGACASGTAGISVDQSFSQSGTTISVAEMNAMNDKYNALNDSNAVAVDDLPTSAVLNGYASFEDDGYDDSPLSSIVGNASVVANFESSTMTGEIGSFTLYEVDCTGTSCEHSNPHELDGTLDVNGEIEGTSFGGSIEGRLTANDVYQGDDADGNPEYGTSHGDFSTTMTQGQFYTDDGLLLAGANISGQIESTDPVDGSADITNLKGVLRLSE